MFIITANITSTITVTTITNITTTSTIINTNICTIVKWAALIEIVRVSGTEMYGKLCAGCSADWYSAVGVG